VDQRTLVFIVAVVLIMFGGSIAVGAKRLFAFLRTRLPSLPSASGLFTAKLEIEWWKLAAILVVGWFFLGGASWQGCKLPTLPAWFPLTTKVTAVTYIYEKDDTAIPSPVEAGLNRINRELKVPATVFEQDTTDGTGETPEQYKIPLAAAKSAGLPSLVVTAGKVVKRVVKNPTTEEQTWGAAQ
jgi:hypothetical protein